MKLIIAILTSMLITFYLFVIGLMYVNQAYLPAFSMTFITVLIWVLLETTDNKRQI